MKAKKVLAVTAGVLCAVCLTVSAAAVSITQSEAVLKKQRGGIPGQLYEYYTFNEHSNGIYEQILTLNYTPIIGKKTDGVPDGLTDISKAAVMHITVDNELSVLPDRYLSDNFSTFDVKCDVSENDWKFLRLKFSGTGVTDSGDEKNISFDVVVDWHKVYENEKNSIYIEQHS